MNESTRKEIELLSSRILRSYFCDCDVEVLISAFDPDIIWLGAGENQRAEGKEAVANCFRSGKKDLSPSIMTNERYVTAEISSGCYLCQGDSWLEAIPGINKYFRSHQRVTFIFKRDANGEYKLIHIHNSLSFADLLKDELFPAQASQEAYKRLEELLVQKDSQIELMLSQLPGGMLICRYDKDYNIKWISDSLCFLLGYNDNNDFISETANKCRSFILEEDYDNKFSLIKKAFENNEDYNIEYRIRKKDGSIFWALDLGKFVTDESGEVFIYCFISDITERKNKEIEYYNANIELKRKAQFLTQLYNTVPCGIIQFTTDGFRSIINLNRAVWEFYGFSSEAEYRDSIKDPCQLVLSRDRMRIEQIIDSLKLNGETVSYTRESIRQDGNHVWLSVVMERLINADGLEVIQAVFTDITDIHNFQETQDKERLLENRSLRAAICTAYPLIMSINLTKNTYNCFIEDRGTYGIDRAGIFDDLLENTVNDIYPTYQDDYREVFSRKNIIKRFESGEHILYTEHRQKGVDGLYHWVAVNVIYVDNPFNSDVLAIELVKVLDVQREEQARQEQLLRDAVAAANSANNAKSNFLSRMSHDIRTPMNAIIGMSAIGQMQIDDPARVKDCFKKIDASSMYLLSLINDILDMSKIETGKMTLIDEKFDFSGLISGITSILFSQAVEHGIVFEVSPHEPLERFYIGDALKLKQVLLNLLSNAMKFTESNGTVRLDISETKRNDESSFITFIVSDTGIGISEEFMSRIFHPFEQETSETARNNIGSGLGLAIVYNLVQIMNGTIDVESQKGKGTSFKVTVPLGIIEDSKTIDKRDNILALTSDMKILVTDDDIATAKHEAEIFSETGAFTKYACSGMEAEKEVSLAVSEGNPYDVVIVDWHMKGIDGVETIRRIRRIRDTDIIIIVSAYDCVTIESEARKAGADYFISKPLFRSSIYETLNGIFLNDNLSEKTNEPISFSGQKILLVEDNDLNMEISKSLLEMNGLEVIEAGDGSQALEIFRNSPENNFLAVLMDIRMPVMDGLTATRSIRSLDRKDALDVPIIAMSANAFEEDKQVAFQSGMSGYIVKPLDINLLLQELESIIEKQKQSTFFE